jgi:uncharacterized membrane protein YjdF
MPVMALGCHVRFCCFPIFEQFVALIALFRRFPMTLLGHVLLACFLSTKRFGTRLTFRHLYNPVAVAMDSVKIKIIKD